MKIYVLCAVFLCLILAAECKSKSKGLQKKAVTKYRGGNATIITDCTKSVNKDFEGFLDAFNARDFKKWATYYHKDFYYITPGVPSLLSKKQFVNYYKYILTRNPMIMIKFSIPEVFCMDARSAVGTCIFQWNFRPGTFGRAPMVWIKDNKGIWKMFKEAVDGADMPQSLPELQYHWNKNGMVNIYKDNETVEINDMDIPKDPFYKVVNGKLVDA